MQHGRLFDHAVYGCREFNQSRDLRIYLEGDGTPWIGETRVADDPTPTHPVALSLLRLDPTPSLLLGRPCYHGLNNAPACSASIWTDQRYSKPVVDSMVAALQSLIERHGASNVTLIGYSGGGTLAMLIASRIGAVHQLVTVAANLDVAAWSRYHHYSALEGSLDPASLPPLRASVRQLHLVGAQDKSVPAWLSEPVIRRQPNAVIRVVAGADHGCCWDAIWPGVLDTLRSAR